jgi:uncharacterized protein (TIGR03435 family)
MDGRLQRSCSISSPQAPSFEVASIKPSNDPGTETWVMQNQSGELTGHNATLRALIRNAYNVRDYQILGGPPWIDAQRYEVLAKPHGRVSGAAFQQMTQALLEDRFRLKLHREMRDLPAFALTVAKKGALLSESKSDAGVGCGYNAGHLSCKKITMAIFAQTLARRLGRSVIDRTGLTGTYDLQLEWTPDESQVPGSAENGRLAGTDSGGPSLFTAIQEQIGLKLDPIKAPVEVIIIDGAERPSQN